MSYDPFWTGNAQKCSKIAQTTHLSIFWALFFTHVSLENWNKLRLSFECGIPRPTRTYAGRCGNTFAFVTAYFQLIQCIISIAVLENVVTKKSHLFYTNRRSVRDRGTNPGHLRGRPRRKPLSHPLRLITLFIYFSLLLLFSDIFRVFFYFWRPQTKGQKRG
jgi:hypothetical protein